jgi:DNA-binding MarR family transcriptional regulator
MHVNEAVTKQPESLESVMEGRDMECLVAIVKLEKQNQSTPTLDEIGTEMNLTKARVLHYVERLELKNIIRRRSGTGKKARRSIEVDANFKTLALALAGKEER